jgi:hypothetical protein
MFCLYEETTISSFQIFRTYVNIKLTRSRTNLNITTAQLIINLLSMHKPMLAFIFGIFFSCQTNAQDDVKRPRSWTLEQKFYLSQNAPNPFFTDGETLIEYRALSAYTFSVIVFDARETKVLQFDHLPGYEGNFKIKGSDLIPGEYWYALIINGRRVLTRKLKLLGRDVNGGVASDRSMNRVNFWENNFYARTKNY